MAPDRPSLELRKGCSAPWTDVYMSSADNWTSCCCFYLGDRLNAVAPNGDLHSLGDIHESAGLEALRDFQSGGPHVDGCGTCPYSIDARPAPQPYFDFTTTEAYLSERQQANLDLVRSDFQRGETRPTSKPLRAAFYFSWGCNLSCAFCYQVRRRQLSWPVERQL